jgi:hypothetical protein
MNETLNKFIAIMGNQEVARSVTPRVKLGIPSNFDRDRAEGHTFLTSCELYISLTASDFVDEQVHIHWALSYFKGGCVVSFTEHILWQELRSGKMCFASSRTSSTSPVTPNPL